MKSIDRLVAEHELIERGLDLLEKCARLLASDQPAPDEFVRWAPGFFAEFADRCHHAKEEDLFFPRLKERGIPEQGGPIGVMLHEHEVGRDCVRRMRDSSAGDPFDQTQFCTAAREFIPLLRQHIVKENQVLFQMAASVLTADDDRDLDARFSEVEQQRDLSGRYDQYLADVVRWEQELT